MYNTSQLKDELVQSIAAILLRHLGVTHDDLQAQPEKYFWVIDDAWRIARESEKAIQTAISI